MNQEKKNILIISNDTELSGVLSENLSSRGYSVTDTRDSGEKLLKTIEEISPALVIVGMAVSCMEAIELCLRVRRWCHVPIIMVKGWGITKELVSKFEDCDIGRPYEINDLVLRIETVFSKN